MKISRFLAIMLPLLAFTSGVFSVSAATVDPMKLPKLTQYVEDFSNVLSQTDLESLRQAAREYEKKTTVQVVVVLFPTREGNELFDIGMRIFKDNAIGQKGKDNGILLVIATDEKKIRIITGYGLEGDIPDVLASDMIEKDIRPLVNEAKYTEAIRAFFARVDRAVWSDEGKNLQTEADRKAVMIASAMAFVFGLVFSFNVFFLGFALFLFAVASLLVGSIYPILAFFLGASIVGYIGLHYFSESFRKNFFEKPKSGGGWNGGSWGWRGWGGGGFSGGGGSSGGGGAGD